MYCYGDIIEKVLQTLHSDCKWTEVDQTVFLR